MASLLLLDSRPHEQGWPKVFSSRVRVRCLSPQRRDALGRGTGHGGLMRAGWQWILAQTVDHIPCTGFCAGVSRASSILYAVRAVWSSYSGTAASCRMKLASCVASPRSRAPDAPCCLLFEKCLPNDARLKARQFGAVGGELNCCARRGGADWRHCTMAALPDTVPVPLASEAMGAWKACAMPTSRSHRAPRIAVQVGRGIMLQETARIQAVERFGWSASFTVPTHALAKLR